MVSTRNLPQRIVRILLCNPAVWHLSSLVMILTASFPAFPSRNHHRPSPWPSVIILASPSPSLSVSRWCSPFDTLVHRFKSIAALYFSLPSCMLSVAPLEKGKRERMRSILCTSSIILLFSQQTEPPYSLSRSRNFHINRRKKEKLKLPTTAITKNLA